MYGFVTLYMNVAREYVGPYFFFQVYSQPVHMTAIWCAVIMLGAFGISAGMVGLSRLGRR